VNVCPAGVVIGALAYDYQLDFGGLPSSKKKTAPAYAAVGFSLSFYFIYRHNRKRKKTRGEFCANKRMILILLNF
jgi:hypothetical protein